MYICTNFSHWLETFDAVSDALFRIGLVFCSILKGEIIIWYFFSVSQQIFLGRSVEDLDFFFFGGEMFHHILINQMETLKIKMKLLNLNYYLSCNVPLEVQNWAIKLSMSSKIPNSPVIISITLNLRGIFCMCICNCESSSF